MKLIAPTQAAPKSLGSSSTTTICSRAGLASTTRKRATSPLGNLIHVHIPPGESTLNRDAFARLKAEIDRGITADQQFPKGRAYLLDTPDKTRSVRSAYFDETAAELRNAFPFEILEIAAIENRQDVLFYFTGLPQIPQLKMLKFVPGVLADHLTSFGGQLIGSGQMSSLDWLEAGATASYRTVVEPCNHPQKFPFPLLTMFHFGTGATAIEAYWKSVAWPGEGLIRIRLSD